MSLNFVHEWPKMSSWDLSRVVQRNQPFTSLLVRVGEFECHFVLNRRNDVLVLRSELELQNGQPLPNLSAARCSLGITFKYGYVIKTVSSHRTPSGQGVTANGKVFWVEYEDLIPAMYFERITLEDYSELVIKLHIASKPADDVEDMQTVANSEFSTMKASADLLSTLLRKGDFWDVLLVSSDGREFRAHRNILSARSPVFAAMLATDMKEKNENRIVMENVDSELLEALLKFIYSGTLEQDVRPGFHEALFGIADQYALPDLRAAVLSAIRVDKDNYGKLQILADRHGDTKLRGRILDFIASNCSELKKRSRANSLFDV